MIRVGRIPYINCFPVYRAIDDGIVPLRGELVSGVPTELNRLMAEGALQVSVVSAIECAARPDRYVILPDLAVSCDGPVRSVLLLSKRPAEELDDATIIVSRSSMTSVALLQLLFRHVWNSTPAFRPGSAELSDIGDFDQTDHDARLVIGDAALKLRAAADSGYQFVYDLGSEWNSWTGLPFVFALWVAQRSLPENAAALVHQSLVQSRNWGLRHIELLAQEASRVSGVAVAFCQEYLSGLDYNLSERHLSGLSEFLRRLALDGLVPSRQLNFLPAA